MRVKITKASDWQVRYFEEMKTLEDLRNFCKKIGHMVIADIIEDDPECEMEICIYDADIEN